MKIRQLTQTSLMIAAIIVLGMIPPIPLGIIPVPIVMQNLGIMLAGLFLGSKNGTIAVGCSYCWHFWTSRSSPAVKPAQQSLSAPQRAICSVGS